MSVTIMTWFPNQLAFWLFIIVFCLWAASEFFNTFGSRRSRPAPGALRRDRGSYWIILLIVWGSMFVSFAARALHLGVFLDNLQFLGLLLAAAGIAFREWAVLTLGRYFTVAVTFVAGQALVKRGPYHWLRHPTYSGSILTLGGLPISLGTWAGALVVLGLSLAGYLYRVRIEEQAMLDAFGDEYRQYMQHTWRFFPGL